MDFENKELLTKTKQKQTTIKNYIEQDDTMKIQDSEDTQQDITPEQVEEGYWHTTSHTKLDGSTAMMETRISACVEAGGSQEECSKKVKTRMKKAGSENTNTSDIEDMDKKPKDDDEEEDDETKDKKKDFVSICPKELDMLKEKATKLDALETENKTLKGDMESFTTEFKKLKADMEVINTERNAELETKRLEKVKEISKDFDLPIEEIQEDSMKDLEKLERRFNAALKRNPSEDTVDAPDITAQFTALEAQGEALMARYRHS